MFLDGRFERTSELCSTRPKRPQAVSRSLVTLCVALAMSCLSAGSEAKVATISLGEMARHSDFILVAKVDHVVIRAGVKIARIRAIQFIKGGTERPIAFVAEPTWRCDTSAAVGGERVLLYLSRASNERTVNGQNLGAVKAACKREGTQLFELSHSGRGRIRLNLHKGQWVAPVTPGEGRGPSLNVNLYIPRPINTLLTSPGHSAVSLADLIKRSKK